MRTTTRYTTGIMLLAVCSSGFVGVRANALAEEQARLVFATFPPSEPAFLGGITGADHACRETAEAEGLTGVYLALLGDGAIGPVNRFEPEAGPLVNVRGHRVAHGWRALAAGVVEAPILQLDGTNGTVEPWTNVRPDGTSGLGATACDRWWRISDRHAGAVGLGGKRVVACDAPRPFICVEQ